MNCAHNATHRLRPRTVSDSSLRFAPAFAHGETPFRMTAVFQTEPLPLGREGANVYGVAVILSFWEVEVLLVWDVTRLRRVRHNA